MKVAILLAIIGVFFWSFGVFSYGTPMPVVLVLIGLGFIAAALVRLGYVLVMRSDE